MHFWERLIARKIRRNRKDRSQCARDIALAASFVRTLETEDSMANVELRQLALDLDRIAGQLARQKQRRAA